MNFSLPFYWPTLRLGALLILVAVFALGFGFFSGHRLGLFLALIFLIVMILIFFNHHQGYFLQALCAKKILGVDSHHLVEKVHQICAHSGVPEPEIHVAPQKETFALTLGYSHKRGVLVISQGLLDKFSDVEVGGVLALLLALMMQKKRWHHFFWNRSRHFLDADQLAFHWLQDRALLAEVLWKLENHLMAHPFAVSIFRSHCFLTHPIPRPRSGSRSRSLFHFRSQSSMSVFPIAVGTLFSYFFGRGGIYDFYSLFYFHPKLERRIKSLLGYYPL